MKKIFLGLLVIVALFHTASALAYVEKQTATVRIMNKAAGKAQSINVTVGKKTEYEKLTILIRSCKQTDPFMAEDFFAFTEISKNSDQIFGGWLSRSEPGDNPLQDADYDVWLVQCE